MDIGHTPSPSTAQRVYFLRYMLLWLSVGREGRIVPFVVVEWGREGDPRLGSASETRMQNLSEASEPTTKLLGNFFVVEIFRRISWFRIKSGSVSLSRPEPVK